MATILGLGSRFEIRPGVGCALEDSHRQQWLIANAFVGKLNCRSTQAWDCVKVEGPDD